MLVSVIVATYNCEAYLIETLNSVYRQTYKDIELIVTDDCSKDNSVLVVKNWLENHKDRFVHTIQTQTAKNSGVTANYNNGFKNATGEWVKCLDGDDLLPENAIECYVKCCQDKPQYKLWYSSEQSFNNQELGTVNHSTLPVSSARRQMIYLLNNRLLGICTATNFIHRKTFVSQGMFNERYPMYQDGSPFLQALARRQPVGIFDKITLLKRDNPKSLMHTANPIMVQNIRDCHFYYARYYLRYGMPLHFYNAWVTFFLSTHDTNRFGVKVFGYFLRCFDFINIYKKICSSR